MKEGGQELAKEEGQVHGRCRLWGREEQQLGIRKEVMELMQRFRKGTEDALMEPIIGYLTATLFPSADALENFARVEAVRSSCTRLAQARERLAYWWARSGDRSAKCIAMGWGAQVRWGVRRPSVSL
ncbi:unnamed protein product [Discosporangium mesarthrocarpum]